MYCLWQKIVTKIVSIVGNERLIIYTVTIQYILNIKVKGGEVYQIILAAKT